ncbi:hypothetical protein D3C86_1675990 [compost metagenome]
MFGASGRADSSVSFSKSAAMVSTPAASSAVRDAASEKRDTPITRCPVPAISMAWRARRAIDGPILPPTPNSIISPFIRLTSSTNAAEGFRISCSNRVKLFIWCVSDKITLKTVH